MDNERSGDLIARWREGDQQAAEALFHRYAGRLVALARGRLSAQLAQRIDPEDIVQSAYRSFFADSRAGSYHCERGGDLWHLLVRITLFKLQDKVKYNRRAKRSVQREQSFGAADFGLDDLPGAREPAPEEVVALIDQLEHVMRGLEPLHRRMLELRLRGCNVEEIAAQTDRTQRTVCRVLEMVKQMLLKQQAG